MKKGQSRWRGCVLVCLMAAVQCSLEDGTGMELPLDEDASFTILWAEERDPALKPQVESDDVMKGLLPNKLLSSDDHGATVRLATAGNEVYSCVLPDLTGSWEDGLEEGADGSSSSPAVLLAPLMGSCIKLLMGYWSYEFCHGMYLRQYHEEKAPSGKSKLDEYFLGKEDFAQSDSETTPTEEYVAKAPPPRWYVNGADRPYFEVVMTGGTPCDLRGGEPRDVRIKYICDTSAPEMGTLLSVEESTTCRYEAVVSTVQLCGNRGYRLRENPLHTIQCYPEGGAPRRPSVLLEHELFSNRFTTTAAASGGQRSKQSSPAGKGAAGGVSADTPAKKQLDDQFIIAFLNGDACLLGGVGWWKHEICYGKYVRQIHSDAKHVVEVVLGWWNEEQHVEWFSRAGKRKHSEIHVVHLYTGGDVCDVTGQERQCQVKFKCTRGLSETQISLSLQEPTPCSYVLTVEGHFICTLLETADQNGLLSYIPQSQRLPEVAEEEGTGKGNSVSKTDHSGNDGDNLANPDKDIHDGSGGANDIHEGHGERPSNRKGKRRAL